MGERLVDRDVIIVRDGVKATNAHHGNFQTILKPPLAPLEVARGWGSADLRSKLATFRFVNSHPEAWGPEAIALPWLGSIPIGEALSWGSLALFPLMSLFLAAPVAASFAGLFSEQVSERVEAALYRIAEAASAASDLQAFYREVHATVGTLMSAENFYIALYDDQRKATS